MISSFVSNWSGTLISYPTEKPLMSHIGEGELIAALRRALTLSANELTVRGLWRARKKLRALYERHRAGEIEYDEMYRAFNEGVLRYVPLDVVERRVREYAESEETQAEINEPLLRHLADAKKKHGFPAAILSASSRLGIELALQKMGYGKLFDKVVGNDFRETPQGCRFDLRIRERDRTRHLGKLIGDFGAKLETTALMDSRQDLLAIVGYPILSPYAYADSDERMRSELGRQRDHRELVFAEEPSDYERRGPFIVGDSLDFQAILEELAGEPSA